MEVCSPITRCKLRLFQCCQVYANKKCLNGLRQGLHGLRRGLNGLSGSSWSASGSWPVRVFMVCVMVLACQGLHGLRQGLGLSGPSWSASGSKWSIRVFMVCVRVLLVGFRLGTCKMLLAVLIDLVFVSPQTQIMKASLLKPTVWLCWREWDGTKMKESVPRLNSQYYSYPSSKMYHCCCYKQHVVINSITHFENHRPVLHT